MGHNRLGRLPKTQSWPSVVALIAIGGSTSDIAAAAAKAAENSLAHAASDPVLHHAFWLLTQLPVAARAPDFAARLRELKIDAGETPSLLSLAAAFQESVETGTRRSADKTDLGEMAHLAATEALTTALVADLPSLFSATSEDIRYSLGKCAAPDRFAKLARSFFARLTTRNLEYFVSRVIPEHIGPGRGFRSVSDYAEFRQALAQHCYEAAFIVEMFSRDWYAKTNWQGKITPANAAGFVHVALRKLRAELRQRGAHA